MNSKTLIKRHEGLRLKPYKDTEGILTIGYGHNLEEGIPKEVALMLFEHKMNQVYSECLMFDWYRLLNHARQAVIENMLFNLGLTRFRGFKKMIKALEERDYDKAAIEMMDSKWSRQVGDRAVELAEMMRTRYWND